MPVAQSPAHYINSVCVISLYFLSHMPTVNILVLLKGSARYSRGEGMVIA
jgi:hypothetical protein